MPGDPELVSRDAAELARAGQEIVDQVAQLRKIAGGSTELQGETADKIRSSAEDLAGQLGKVVGRYQKVSQALSAWAPELEYAQSQSVQALYEAQDAAVALRASAPLTRSAGRPETAEEKAEDQSRARSSARAEAGMGATRSKLDAAVAYRDAKSAETAAKIDRPSERRRGDR